MQLFAQTTALKQSFSRNSPPGSRKPFGVLAKRSRYCLFARKRKELNKIATSESSTGAAGQLWREIRREVSEQEQDNSCLQKTILLAQVKLASSFGRAVATIKSMFELKKALKKWVFKGDDR